VKKYKFLLSRTSLIQESYWVEADTEEEALELGFNGEVDNDEPALRQWIDYYDDEWSVDERVSQDDLVIFVKSKETV
jgi:hypothetical protein